MKIKIDYTLHIRGVKLQPISIKTTSDFYESLYKYNEFYIYIMMSKSNDDSYSGIVYKNKQFYDKQQLDGKNVICTNFCITYEELIQELETSLLLIEKKNKKNVMFGDVSVN